MIEITRADAGSSNAGEPGRIRLESEWFHGVDDAPPFVLLHEGLGSVSMWRDFPSRLAASTGRAVFAWSRAGYGKSDGVSLPRPLDYMQIEGSEIVPRVLDAAGIRSCVLVGHSDGASIAIVHAATEPARVRGLVLMAPHVFCEDVSVASIERARVAYAEGDLRARLARHHGANVDIAFWGWNRAWLDPAFRRWTIEAYVERIDAPMLLVQGEDDEYGTVAQLDAIERRARATVRRLVLPRCGHAPHRDCPSETLAAITAFSSTL